MRKFIVILLLITGTIACKKTESAGDANNNGTVINKDSTEFTGRLYVYTYDYTFGNTLNGSEVYLYANYDDIKRRLHLFKQTTNSSAEADMGFLLQGNYYIVANYGIKTDTAMVQILSKKVVKKNMYLQ